MQKITLKYEHKGNYEAISRTYTMEFDSEGMTFEEFLDEIERFALVMGYHPDTIKEGLNRE